MVEVLYVVIFGPVLRKIRQMVEEIRRPSIPLGSLRASLRLFLRFFIVEGLVCVDPEYTVPPSVLAVGFFRVVAAAILRCFVQVVPST